MLLVLAEIFIERATEEIPSSVLLQRDGVRELNSAWEVESNG